MSYQEWNKQFTRHIKLAIEASEKVFKASVKILYKRIYDRTPLGDPALWKWPAPKDYVPGHLKASWTLELEGTYAKIRNDADYSYRIETGWSTRQAPEGMMRISVMEFPDIVEATTKAYRLI